MRRENYTIQPECHTAAEVAKRLNMSEAQARHILEGFVAAGLADRGPDDSYRITGKGLAVGEQAGFVKPFDPIHGYGDGEGKILQ